MTWRSRGLGQTEEGHTEPIRLLTFIKLSREREINSLVYFTSDIMRMNEQGMIEGYLWNFGKPAMHVNTLDGTLQKLG